MTATHEAIVGRYLAIPPADAQRYNWGTGYVDGNHMWNVGDDTYINGVVLTVDGDYMMGYLLEVVERESSVVSYVVIVTFHGPNPKTGKQDHDSKWYEHDCGTFFDRKVDQAEVATWAVGQIYGLWESWQDAQNQQRAAWIQWREDVWNVLVEECGAREDVRREFMHHWPSCGEFRFQGELGFGGKIHDKHRWPVVSCYPEDASQEVGKRVLAANQRLLLLGRPA